MTNIIDPRLREIHTIDGMKFEIRPLSGADRIEVSETPNGLRVPLVARKIVTNAWHTPYEWGVVMTTDDLQPETITQLAILGMKLSGLSRDDEKNSQSGPRSSTEESRTPRDDANSNTATKQSTACLANAPGA